MTRAARISALAVALAALSSATAGAQTGPKVVPTGGPLYHTVDVAPNSINTFTVTCPPGYVALSGTMSDADGATPLRSVPAGARAWTFSVGLPVTATRSSHVRVMVVCVKPRPLLPGIKGKVSVKLKVAVTKSKPVVIPPGQTEETKLRCPAGYAPTGSGLEVAPVGSKGARAAAVLSNGQVARETTDLPVRGGFQLVVHNPAGESQTVKHSGRCLRRIALWRRHGHRRRHRAVAQILRTIDFETATPGSNLFQHDVPAGHLPIGAGHSYASAADMIVFGHAIGNGKVLTPVINGESTPLRYAGVYQDFSIPSLALK